MHVLQLGNNLLKGKINSWCGKTDKDVKHKALPGIQQVPATQSHFPCPQALEKKAHLRLTIDQMLTHPFITNHMNHKLSKVGYQIVMSIYYITYKLDCMYTST